MQALKIPQIRYRPVIRGRERPWSLEQGGGRREWW
jgi:hypothetical protein